MAKAIQPTVELSETLHLTECNNGFWLYDDTRGMNLAMGAKTATDAFVEALTYYQRRLGEVESDHKALTAKVDAFVSQFAEDDTD